MTSDLDREHWVQFQKGAIAVNDPPSDLMLGSEPMGNDGLRNYANPTEPRSTHPSYG